MPTSTNQLTYSGGSTASPPDSASGSGSSGWWRFPASLAALAAMGAATPTVAAVIDGPAAPARTILSYSSIGLTTVPAKAQSATGDSDWFSNTSGPVSVWVHLDRPAGTMPAVNYQTIPDWPSFAPGSLAWAEIFSDLARWKALPPGWDGADGIPLSPVAFVAARAIGQEIRAAKLPKPDHFIAVDGEISFDWKGPGKRASISIDAEGKVVAYCQRVDTPLLEVEEDNPEVIDWGELFEALRTFA